MTFTLRPEHTEDAAGINLLLRTAFPDVVEANLVQRLRAAGDLALSLVADENGTIIGHIGFVPIKISPDPNYRIWGLAPLSVTPERQRQGIGGALIRAGLEQARRSEIGLVLVLGDQNYYGRFGFLTEIAAGIEVAWSGQHFAGIALRDMPHPRGRARYPQAFSALE
jgi:putative acetyltransferase